MPRNRPVSLALVGLFVWVTACHSYAVIPTGEVAEHGRVRVTLTNGGQETLHDPWIESDSIKGLNQQMVRTLGPQRSVDLSSTAYALEEIVGVEAVGTDEVGTVFTVLGILALAGVVLVVVCAASGDCFQIMQS